MVLSPHLVTLLSGGHRSLTIALVRVCVCVPTQLFYALEQKEQQLEQAMQEKESLEQEVLTARQLSARGGGSAEPKFIEIHHHNDISDDEDEEEKPAPVS